MQLRQFHYYFKREIGKKLTEVRNDIKDKNRWESENYRKYMYLCV